MSPTPTLQKEHHRSWTKTVIPPPRSSPLASVLVVSLSVALTASTLVSATTDRWILAGGILLLATAVLCRAVYALHMALLTIIWIVMVGLSARFRLWPFHLLIPLAGYGLVVAAIAPLRRSVGWLRAGHFRTGEVGMVVATVIVSTAALILWTMLTQPDLRRHLALLKAIPFWAYPFVAIGFAFLNAAMEEAVFRGIMLEALDSALGERGGSISLQAVSFAAFHYPSGFPNGVLGFLMVLVYGVMLGLIRRRSEGMIAPWVAHVAADLTIFITLAVVLVRR